MYDCILDCIVLKKYGESIAIIQTAFFAYVCVSDACTFARSDAAHSNCNMSWHVHTNNCFNCPNCRTDVIAGPSPCTLEYMNRIRAVGRDAPELLVAHAYTRYLGDLSGGQVCATQTVPLRAMATYGPSISTCISSGERDMLGFNMWLL